MYHVLPHILCIYSFLCLEKSYFLFSPDPFRLRFSSDISRKSFQISPIYFKYILILVPLWKYIFRNPTHSTLLKTDNYCQRTGVFQDSEQRNSGKPYELYWGTQIPSGFLSIVSLPSVLNPLCIFSLLHKSCLFSSLHVCFILLLLSVN